MNSKADPTQKAFEQTIKFLQTNLQHLADNGKVSKKYIVIQNERIKALVDYYNHSEQRLKVLENELFNNAFCISNLLNEQDKKIETLEAICLLHGISDFPAWIAKGRSYLIAELLEHRKNQTVIVPEIIHEYIQALPIASKAKLIELLKKGRNTKVEQLELFTNKKNLMK